MITTLQSHESKSGNGPRGPWTLNIFQTSSGLKVQTFDKAIASAALDLLGERVEMTYTEEKRGEFTNYTLTSISPAPEGAAEDSAPAGTKAAFDTAKQEVINRSAGLSRAIEAYATSGLEPLSDLEGVQELALRFAAFIETGEIVAAEVTA